MAFGKQKQIISWSLLAIWFVNLDSWSDSIAIETQHPAPSVRLHSSNDNDLCFLYFFAFVVLQMVVVEEGGCSRERGRENLGKGLLCAVTVIHCDVTFWIFSPAQPSATPYVTVTSQYCN